MTFSLGFHLGKMTPQECIDFLVDKVGHERENATAEVRRSFQGGYPPLYQAGYLIGAKQFWALRQELVDERQDDREGVPRRDLEGRHPAGRAGAGCDYESEADRDFTPGWKFLGELSAAEWPKK